jgi:hypothetical protein
VSLDFSGLVKGKTRKAPRGKSESPWSLYIGIFWKIHFINPPEVRGQVVRLKIKEGITMVKK